MLEIVNLFWILLRQLIYVRVNVVKMETLCVDVYIYI